MWKTTRCSAVNAVSCGLSHLKRNTQLSIVRAVGLNLLNRSNTMARRVFRFMASLTVWIGLWFMAFFLCLVTAFVAIPIVWLCRTLSVGLSKIKSN